MRFGLVLAVAGVLFAQANDFDVRRGGLHSMVDDELTTVARRMWEAREHTVAGLTTAGRIQARQQWARARFIELLGGFPEKTPLNARITGSFERPGYRVEKLIYESLPRFFVTANVYVPTGRSGPFPAVVGVAGHTDNGKAAGIYQRAFIGMARRGFLVLALDPPGQGERLQYFDTDLGMSRVGAGTREHTLAGLQCLLTGTNFARYEIWDSVRAVDYLVTRKDVDAKRLAVAGNSGGGTQSAYLAMVEPRLVLAAPSCYITSSEKLWELGPQDAEQNLTGFLEAGLGMADFPLAFAPKPYLILTATRDFFPIAGAREVWAEARRIYTTLGHPEAIRFFEYDDTHGWSLPRREATYRWLERWFHQREDDGAEGDYLEEPASALNVTPTGQVATSLGGETVHGLNFARAQKLVRSRKPVTAELVRRRLAIHSTGAGVRAEDAGTLERGGMLIDKILLASGPGVSIPALVFRPKQQAGRRPVVLYLDSKGKAAGAGAGQDPAALVEAGFLVVAADLRGTGETATGRGSDGYDGAYQTLMRALLVGRTMLGMQVEDLLAVTAYAAGRPDVDASRISVLAKGEAGPVALIAAVLEPRLNRIAVEGGILSYQDYVRVEYPRLMPNLIVPGILEDFDLPAVAAALEPRPIWLVNPALPSTARAPLPMARAEYKAAANVQVFERPDGWPFATFYKGWLEP